MNDSASWRISVLARPHQQSCWIDFNMFRKNSIISFPLKKRFRIITRLYTAK